ncbi:uncharacterized protein [Amphiura filiformis]|uniref:uncharacterized protein n=1 Tax=Amphiura filiformis TaxID=82378 RepID=UPI003B216387
MPSNTPNLKSSMTFWSRHDPVMMRQGNTDYWPKMKNTSTTMEIALPSGQVVSHAGHKATQVPKGQEVATFQFNKNGTLSQIPDKTFNELIARQLHANLPGTYRSQSASNSRSLRTSYNERAKTGFKYWSMDRPKPTKFGRYGIGSANTVLGLGNSIRT